MRVVPALLAIAALHALFFADVLVGGRTLSPAPYTSGLTPTGPFGAPPPPPAPILDVEGAAWVDEPSPVIARRLLDGGGMPLWNPWEGFGTPFAANLNSGAASPVALPLNLAPGPAAADAFYLARLALLAFFTWLHLRSLALAGLACVLGAVVVAYGGYALAWIVHHPLSAELFLPLVLAGFEWGRRGRAAGWVAAVAGVAGALLGGKLQAALMVLAFAAAWAVVRARTEEGGRRGATVAAAAAAVAAGIAMAAFLLVPASELLARTSGLTLGARSGLAAFTLPWASLASAVAPGMFAPAGAWWPPGLPLTPAIGVVAATLAVVGAVARRSPHRGVARLCAAWAVLLLARNLGLLGSAWWASLPVLGGILFVKYAFTAVYALGVLAAIGADVLHHGLVEPRRWTRAAGAFGLGAAVVAGAALAGAVPTRPEGLVPTAVAAAVVGMVAVAALAGLLRGRAVALVLTLAAVVELRALAPDGRPVRRDPYAPPPWVAFVRGAGPGRILASPDLGTPLTSTAAGLADLRAIDVLTPGSYYAFFVRLLSFCPRLIHFTADPDLALAATAPAADLAAVRWVVSRGALAGDLPARVAAQVEHERIARLFAGLERFAVDPARLALGDVEAAGVRRWSVTLEGPVTLDLTARSEAPVLAWDAHVLSGDARVSWRTTVEGQSAALSGDATLAADGAWHPTSLVLGAPGVARRVRLVLRLEPAFGGAVRVAFGSLGFSPGADAERTLAATRSLRHQAELAALEPVFRDPASDVIVYENRNALARVFRVAAAEPVASLDAALTRLGDGFDFRRAALVQGQAPPGIGAAPDVDVTALVRVLGETPLALDVVTAGARPGVLVIADLAFPGWRATIDGEPAELLQVDGVFRGVAVPAGDHRVRLAYRPTSWVVGAALSVLGVVLVVPIARAGARAHRRGPGFGPPGAVL